MKKIILFIIVSCLFLLPIVYSPLIDENETFNETTTIVNDSVKILPNSQNVSSIGKSATTDNIIEWVNSNQKFIMYGGIGCVVIILVLILGYFVKKKNKTPPIQTATQFHLSYAPQEQEIIDETKKK